MNSQVQRKRTLVAGANKGIVPSYCSSKLALNGATIMLADALRPKGISIYAMCPAWVRTDH